MSALTWIVNLIIASIFIAVAKCLDENTDNNITSLYPVNKTTSEDNSEEVINITDEQVTSNENITKPNEEKNVKNTDSKIKDDNAENKYNKIETVTWKIDAQLTEAKIKDSSVFSKTENEMQTSNPLFKASPQLGTFYNENAFVIPKLKDYGAFTPLIHPPVNYNSPSKDVYKVNRIPVQYYYHSAPYKFENINKPKDVNQAAFDMKPTAEVPVKIPAGGLYKYPDPFKEKPNTDGRYNNYGLEFSNATKETSTIKKRKSPWQNIVDLMTALIPVGIIASALTPGLVTLQSTDNNQQYNYNFKKRADIMSGLPDVSERCKRRLLCEIHSERNYMRGISRSGPRKPCYKIRCEDPESINILLSWLLNHRSGYSSTAYTDS